MDPWDLRSAARIVVHWTFLWTIYLLGCFLTVILKCAFWRTSSSIEKILHVLRLERDSREDLMRWSGLNGVRGIDGWRRSRCTSLLPSHSIRIHGREVEVPQQQRTACRGVLLLIWEADPSLVLLHERFQPLLPYSLEVFHSLTHHLSLAWTSTCRQSCSSILLPQVVFMNISSLCDSYFHDLIVVSYH